MGTANLVELEACLADCIQWCEANPKLQFVEFFHPKLVSAHREFERSIRESDAHYLVWKREEIEDKLAWKHLGNELRTVQTQLSRKNVVGYPDTRMRHWDTEILTAEVQDMVAFLTERKSAIEDAEKMIEGLDMRLGRAQSDGVDERASYLEYRRIASQRGHAFGAVSSVLSKFRESMRRHLGKTNEEYQSLRWPHSLNSDRSIL